MSERKHGLGEMWRGEARRGDLVHAARAWLARLLPDAARGSTDIEWEDGEPVPAFGRPA